MDTCDVQFYPTTQALAVRAWSKFKNRDFTRVLEPSAGKGDLADARPGGYYAKPVVDCAEIDIAKHPTLREKGFNVVGIDFLQFQGGTIYSHIIMNPPFLYGAEHVLKAWSILWDGEIVAILNAETIRNPYTKERQLLVGLIEQHGEVEYIEGAFSGADAERKADVDVALVYLRKEADVKADLLGSFFDDLKRDQKGHDALGEGYEEMNELALANSTIENTVLAFNAAVRATRESVLAEARAKHYTALLGETMAQRCGDGTSDSFDASVKWVIGQLAERYDGLKDRAWTSILRGSQVTSRLSSSAQKQVEAEFEQVKKLEFTVSNVYGFLHGLVQNQGQIQIDMACDVFDQITRYHSDNTVFYKGWKSNDKHRTAGMRIKTTRFILPGHKSESWQRSLSWDSERLLADFDKVFAMLDGKVEPLIGLAEVFRNRFSELRSGKRVSSSYFDVRYYPGIGTIHFFPRDKKLVDRLNRLVGRQRSWLPPEDDRVSKEFWVQYEKAEKFDKEVRAEINMRFRGNHWDNPMYRLSYDQEKRAAAMEAIDTAVGEVLKKHGIDVERLLEPAPKQQRLIAA